MGIIIDRVEIVRVQTPQQNDPRHHGRHHNRNAASTAEAQPHARVTFHTDSDRTQLTAEFVRTFRPDVMNGGGSYLSGITTSLFRERLPFRYQALPSTQNSQQEVALSAFTRNNVDLLTREFQSILLTADVLSDSQNSLVYAAGLSTSSLATNVNLIDSLRNYLILPEASNQDPAVVRAFFQGLSHLSFSDLSNEEFSHSPNLLLTTNRTYLQDMESALGQNPGPISRVSRFEDAVNLLIAMQRPVQQIQGVSDELKNRVHDIAGQVVMYLMVGEPSWESLQQALTPLAVEIYRISPADHRINLLEIVTQQLSHWHNRDFFQQATNPQNFARLQQVRAWASSAENARLLQMSIMNPQQLVLSAATSVASNNIQNNSRTPTTPHSLLSDVAVPAGFTPEWLRAHLAEILTTSFGSGRDAAVSLQERNGRPILVVDTVLLTNNFDTLIRRHMNEESLYRMAALLLSHSLFGNGQPINEMPLFYQNRIQDVSIEYTERSILTRYYRHHITELGRSAGENHTIRDTVIPVAAIIFAIAGAAGLISSIVVAEASEGRTGFVPGEVSAGAMASGIPLGMGAGVLICRAINRPSQNRSWVLQDGLCAAGGGLLGAGAGLVPLALSPRTPSTMMMPPVVTPPPRPETPVATNPGGPLGP